MPAAAVGVHDNGVGPVERVGVFRPTVFVHDRFDGQAAFLQAFGK